MFFCCWDTVFSGGCCRILRLIICCEKRKECHRRCFLLSMFVRFLFVFDLLLILFRIVLWPSVGKELSSRLFTCVFLILNAVLVVLVPFLFGVWGGMWNSIVSAPDHSLIVYFSQSTQASLMNVIYTVDRYYSNILFKEQLYFSPF